jgi:Cu-Zn family superoxide dismutase
MLRGIIMKKTSLLLGLVAIIPLVGCQSGHYGSGQKASATLESRSGSSTKGTVNFVSQGHDILVTGTISGLRPNAEHGFHVHEKGDCSAPDATSAGGHFNPDGKAHGMPGSGSHHSGDMPNIKTDANGNAVLRVRNPSSYKVGLISKTLKSHIHYRICHHSGMLSEVKSVFV